MNTESGILTDAYLQALERMLIEHKHKMWQDKDGRWSTYVRKDGEKRKLIRKSTKEKLELALCEFYGIDIGIRTFGSTYEEWREFHDKLVTNNTISKYNSDKIRYFDKKEFSATPLDNIIEEDIKVFVKETIDDLKLCKAASKKLVYYIKDTLNYAERRGYIDRNPALFITAKEFYKFTYISDRSKKPRTICDATEEILLSRYEADLSKDPTYTPTYAVYFSVYTGLRAGELAGLRWEDDHGDYILVCRSQKYDPIEKKYYISGTKTGADRIVPVTGPAREILDRLKKVNGKSVYIFGHGKDPITFRIICSCIKNKCRQVGIETYGIHANRRTVNSKMAKAGVPVKLRASLLGHSEDVNTKYYTYDVASLDEKMAAMAQVNTKT